MRPVDRLGDAAAQTATLEHVDHRPWPLASTSWSMGQTWRDLLFAHWPVEQRLLRPHVPRELELEEHGGTAWIGITPFRVEGLRMRGLPPVPMLSRFRELNCRTYVRSGDRPGIWFFSLDASSRLAVHGARRTYRLPYHHARIDLNGRFVARRTGDHPVTFEAKYQPVGKRFTAEPGTLEHFLTERYCLYADEGRRRADIHHPPWPLQPAEAEIDPGGLPPAPLEGKPLCHFARRQDVLVWPLQPI
jgi:uncharacterized protein